jgi:release factor glutamine methyltransferase
MSVLAFGLYQVDWKLAPATTVGVALNWAHQRLREAAIDTAYLDAQVLLAYVLEQGRAWLFAHHEATLEGAQAERFTDLIARRVEHEPIAYLVGSKEFYGLELSVDRRVLIPRPETEMLVDEVLREIDAHAGVVVTVADVGTGSAAIALAVAANSERARVYAVDISRGALAVARRNVQRHDRRKQVKLLRGDLLDPLPEPVDVIVANLPYIARAEYQSLDTTVRNYEPRLALESGPEGLDAIVRLLRQAPSHLMPDGKIYLEIGYQQGAAVKRLVHDSLPHARAVNVHRDYQGHDRMVAVAV